MSATPQDAAALQDAPSKWQWEEDGLWRDYDAESQTQIESEYCKSPRPVSFSYRSRATRKNYKVDFSSMQQTNMETGFSRGVRRVLASDTPTHADEGDVVDASPPGELVIRVPFVSPETVLAERAALLENVAKNASVEELAAARERCPICMDDFVWPPAEPVAEGSIVTLNKCLSLHGFHRDCIAALFASSTRCPLCFVIYRELQGTAPVSGTMTVRRHAPGELPLGGYGRAVGTIEIEYAFPSGVQGPEHPAPGEEFRCVAPLTN